MAHIWENNIMEEVIMHGLVKYDREYYRNDQLLFLLFKFQV